MLPNAILDDARALLALLEARGLTLATAESCTGGLIAAALTSIAGSSSVVAGGFVTYSNAMKTRMVGVPEDLLASVGAVSAEVASAMAEGALRETGADLALSCTGIAGPGGATPTKPVGLVFIGCARRGAATRVERHVFPGDRGTVRAATVGRAFAMAKAQLEGGVMTFRDSMAVYEQWLAERLAASGLLVDGLFRRHICEKHGDMGNNNFAFLRATYWRWAELVPAALPKLMDCRKVLAAGDVHIENFGTWRNSEGTLVFGVNDFDEAAEMPWPLDLVRLLTSAVLGREHLNIKGDIADDARAILAGYGAALNNPGAVLADADLRKRVELTSDADRDEFWEKEDEKIKDAATVNAESAPDRYKKRLTDSMPLGASAEGEPYERKAGLGSLGRPRYAQGAVQDGVRIAIEAKALVPSAWTRTGGQGPQINRTGEAAALRGAAHDPTFSVGDMIACRRLSPNFRKIELPKRKKLKEGEVPLPLTLLELMGRDLGALHCATPGVKSAISDEIGRLDKDWLQNAANTLVAATKVDYRAFTSP